MKTISYNIGAGGLRYLVLDGEFSTIDGAVVTEADITAFQANAKAEGVEGYEIDNDTDCHLCDILKHQKFMGAEWEHPGLISLYKVPGMPEGFFINATPWWNGDNDASIEVCDAEGMAVAFFNFAMPDITESTAILLAAYKAGIEATLPDIAAYFQSLSVKEG